MRLPSHVWHLKGSKPGPTVVLMGGTHGDELTGAEIIRLFLESFGLRNTKPHAVDCPEITGELFLAFGNPEAMLRRSRSATGGKRDMNRCFTPGQIYAAKSPEDSLDVVRARQLAPLLARADFLFDIHATSSVSEPFVCFGENSPAHRTLYRQIPVRYVLTDPNIFLSRPAAIDGLGTTDSWTNTHGGVALCYETGYENAVEDVPTHMLTVLSLLESCGLATEQFSRLVRLLNDLDGVAAGAPADQRVYKLTHCELVDKSKDDFYYAEGMAGAIWQSFPAGTLLGCYSDGTEVRLSMSGMLLFPTSSKKLQFRDPDGQSLYYIAQLL